MGPSTNSFPGNKTRTERKLHSFTTLSEFSYCRGCSSAKLVVKLISSSILAVSSLELVVPM